MNRTLPRSFSLIPALVLLLTPALHAVQVAAGAAARISPVQGIPPSIIAPLAAPGQASSRPQLPEWNLSSYQMKERYKAAEIKLLETAETVAAIAPDARTFDNTVLALEAAEADFQDVYLPLRFLGNVSPDKRQRRMADALDRRVSKFYLDYSDRNDLYEAYKQYAAKGETLTGEDKLLAEDALKSFKARGFDLPDAERTKLRQLNQRLSDLKKRFEKNLNGVYDGIEVARAQLDGLPDDYVNGLERTDDGKYRVTMDYPTFFPFMRYAQDESLRKALYMKYENRAVAENLPILKETLELRRGKAQLLKKKNYAQLIIEERMAKSPSRVKKFLNRIKDLLKGPARKEFQLLLDQKRLEHPAATKVHGWERGFYGNKLRQRLYSYDAEEVRQYFPVRRVIEGTLEVYQELLGIRFKELPPDAWHPDAKLFEIRDAKTDKSIAYLYLDLHPRDNKYGHAAQFTLRKGRVLPDGSYQKPVSGVVTNFSKPAPGKPALLTVGEVETFFHELGHAMHETLTQAKHNSYSGASVAWDFVEAPSQMMENFVWEPAVLQKLSGHYQNHTKKLPDDLLRKMMAAKNFFAATSELWSAALAAVDLAYHTLKPPFDTTAVYRKVFKSFGLDVLEPGIHPEASFGHIMGGYAAGYYGYIWSKVFAQDIFSLFKDDGVMSPRVGKRYRETILKYGGSIDENKLLRLLLGREPSEEAFLESIGFPKGSRLVADGPEA